MLGGEARTGGDLTGVHEANRSLTTTALGTSVVAALHDVFDVRGSAVLPVFSFKSLPRARPQKTDLALNKRQNGTVLPKNVQDHLTIALRSNGEFD